MAKISNSQLIPNKTVLVQGEISFSRVTRKIEGEELARRNMGQRYPIDKPYTTMTISNCQVIPENPNKDANGQPILSVNEQYIVQKMYTSAQHPERQWCLEMKNKGNALPTICQREADGTTVRQITPTGELANGLHVTMVIRVFQGKPNCGVSLDTIIVDEPVRYYDPVSTSALADRGLTFIPDAAAKEAAQGNSYWAAPVSAGPAVTEPTQTPVQAPAQGVNPYATAQTQEPVQQAAPVQTAAPVGNPVAGIVQNEAATPVGSPVGGPVPTPGVQYNPGVRNY